MYKPSKNQFFEVRNQEKYQFINPLLECENVSIGTDKYINSLKTKIQNFIKKQINNHQIIYASVYFRDLNNGPWIGVNEKENFSPSSLIKVPIMIAYFKLAESNPDILKTELQVDKTVEFSNQNFKPQITLKPNQKYTIEELIRRMIVYSDNQAYEILNNYLKPEDQIEVFKNLGIDISKGYSDPTGNIISVKSYASFFRILYNASYLNKTMSEKALNLLSETTFNQGLVAPIPPNIVIAHKFGERQFLETGSKQMHDCGIVYTSKPYLLCIMTRGYNFDNLISTINNISALVYKSIQNQN